MACGRFGSCMFGQLSAAGIVNYTLYAERYVV